MVRCNYILLKFNGENVNKIVIIWLMISMVSILWDWKRVVISKLCEFGCLFMGFFFNCWLLFV